MITGWVTTREPEYSTQDRAQLLFDLFERKRPRGNHGLPLDEVTDPANAGAYETPLPLRDAAQTVLNAQKDDYRKRFPDADLDSLLWRVRRKKQD